MLIGMKHASHPWCEINARGLTVQRRKFRKEAPAQGNFLPAIK